MSRGGACACMDAKLSLDTHTNTFGNVVITGGTIDLTGGGGSGKTIVKGSFRNVGGTVNTP